MLVHLEESLMVRKDIIVGLLERNLAEFFRGILMRKLIRTRLQRNLLREWFVNAHISMMRTLCLKTP